MQKGCGKSTGGVGRASDAGRMLPTPSGSRLMALVRGAGGR